MAETPIRKGCFIKLFSAKLARCMHPSFSKTRAETIKIGRLIDQGASVNATVPVPAFGQQPANTYKVVWENGDKKMKITDSAGITMKKTLDEFLEVFGSETAKDLVCKVVGGEQDTLMLKVVPRMNNDQPWDKHTVINILVGDEGECWERVACARTRSALGSTSGVSTQEAQVPEAQVPEAEEHEDDEDDSDEDEEEGSAVDILTTWSCGCGFTAKNKGGLTRHMKKCPRRIVSLPALEMSSEAASAEAGAPQTLEMHSVAEAAPSSVSAASSSSDRVNALKEVADTYEQRLASDVPQRKSVYAGLEFQREYDPSSHSTLAKIEELTATAKRRADEKFDWVTTKVARLKELMGEVETIVNDLEGASSLAVFVEAVD
jgi:hypothetical protein